MFFIEFLWKNIPLKLCIGPTSATSQFVVPAKWVK